MTERHPHDEFMEADAEYSAACQAYNEAADRLWAVTKKRGLAWQKLAAHSEERRAHEQAEDGK